MSLPHDPQRARAKTTLPSFPTGPPNCITPIYFSSVFRRFAFHANGRPPYRHPLMSPRLDDLPQLPPITPATANRNTIQQIPTVPSFPLIYDPQSLLAAIQQNPEHVFARIHGIIKEKDELKLKLKNVEEDYRSSQLDWSNARKKYEELLSIATAKQIILWRFIERLQDQNPGVNGEEGKVQNMKLSALSPVLNTSSMVKKPIDMSASSLLSEPADIVEACSASTISKTESKASSETPKLDPTVVSYSQILTGTFEF